MVSSTRSRDGEVQQSVDVAGGDIDVLHFRLARRARVARRDEYPLHARGLRALPGERMFPTASAHDQHFHDASHPSGESDASR